MRVRPKHKLNNISIMSPKKPKNIREERKLSHSNINKMCNRESQNSDKCTIMSTISD